MNSIKKYQALVKKNNAEVDAREASAGMIDELLKKNLIMVLAFIQKGEPSVKNSEERVMFQPLEKPYPSFENREERKLIVALGFVKGKSPAAKKAAPKKKAAGKSKEAELESDLVKVLTEKEIAKITKETSKAYSALTALPPPPFEKIILGLKLGDYNPKELCSYWFDKAPRITGVSGFSACVPTVAYLTEIANALTPLANIPSIKISSADKTTRDTYDAQLREGIKQIAASCVNLANGNMAMFNLTTFRLKAKAVFFKGQLPAQNFDLYTDIGASKIRVKTKKNKYAKSYTIYHGVGDYNPATWKFQVGSCDQIVKGTAGILENFIIVANSDIEGIWPDPQPKRFPYN